MQVPAAVVAARADTGLRRVVAKKYISGLAGLVPMLDDHLDDIFKNAMVCAYCERYPLLVVDDRHLDAAVEAFYAMLKD